MSDSLREIAFCPVCRDIMLDARVLNCGHTFCGSCLHSLYHQHQSIPCPVCRQVTKPEDANTLPRNHAVREIARKVHEEKQRETVRNIVGENPTVETIQRAISEREEQLKLEAEEEQLMKDWLRGIWKVLEDAERRARYCYVSWKSRTTKEKELLEELMRQRAAATDGGAQEEAAASSKAQQPPPAAKPSPFPTFDRAEADQLTRDFQSFSERLHTLLNRVGSPEDQAKAARWLQTADDKKVVYLKLRPKAKPGEAKQQ